MTELTWRTIAFDDLSVRELYRILDLRAEVFVVEQNCPYRDTDGLDLVALHLLGEREGQLLAYARLLAPGRPYEEPSIGRVITSPSARRTGAGKELMRHAVEEVSQRWPGPIKIGAQCYLERFYGEFGFLPVGESYIEDGIPHMHMIRS
jgi:ElaA protein